MTLSQRLESEARIQEAAKARYLALTAAIEAVEELEGRCHDREGLGCETIPCVENVSRDEALSALHRLRDTPT